MPVEDIVIAEYGEQLRTLAQHRTEGRERTVRECLGIAARIRVVAEEHQRVVRVGEPEVHDRRCGCVELRTRVADVTRERQPRVRRGR